MNSNTSSRTSTSDINRFALPFFFVLLYGSGFVGAKLGLPHSSPLSFLTLRFFAAGILLFFIAYWFGEQRPSWRDTVHIAIAGTLTVCLFSIGVFVSIDMGLTPALSALIIALQPILVALFAQTLINEKMNSSQWLGLFCGFLGVAVVVSQSIETGPFSWVAIGMSVLALLGVTFGSLYQKRFCQNMALFSGGAIQSLTSAFICLLLLPFFDVFDVVLTSEFIIALVYMTVGVSLGALSLLYLMIRRGEVSKVASVFYLTPVSAAVSAYLLFGDTIEETTLLGASIIALGIFLTNRKS
ncbi:DMT family transporter [Psychrobium sp. 1_MG-2023]|uniref:DMT family transporter n=1 Tax=Psychrobium sp. 1_MG-2023 TaxID=3062624 RepID=UPI000C32E77F|nr:DMT family transporter [Psychrobium sp. 1_MG-2023]MDP2562642.1 DMT family transporter [Psychrobium sp. 1_MG-2023]PKF53827.1 EamA/RhaT family transporter [Alteromonadales bacterium alter-6D02]